MKTAPLESLSAAVSILQPGASETSGAVGNRGTGRGRGDGCAGRDTGKHRTGTRTSAPCTYPPLLI